MNEQLELPYPHVWIVAQPWAFDRPWCITDLDDWWDLIGTIEEQLVLIQCGDVWPGLSINEFKNRDVCRKVYEHTGSHEGIKYGVWYDHTAQYAREQICAEVLAE